MKIDQALQDPARIFATPNDLLKDTTFSQDEKIQILRRWEFDAREQAVAEEENMAGGPDNLLPEILAALHCLGATTDCEHTPPTKQGGK